MKKFYAFVLALLASVSPANAQSMSDVLQAIYSGTVVSDTQTAVNLTPAFVIKYVGPQPSGVVTIATNLITLSHGAVGAEVVDNTVECDAAIAASGSRNGILDGSVAACDTIGEIMNTLNAQTSNWVLIPLAGIMTDSITTSGSLVAIAGVQAKTTTGLRVMFGTAVVKHVTLMLARPEYQLDINTYLTNTRSGTTANLIQTNPFQGRTLVSSNRGTFTFTGASDWSVILVRPKYAKSGSSESYQVLMAGTATGATTVNKEFVLLSDGQRIVAPEGTKLLIRVTAVTTLTAANFSGFGYTFTAR